MLRSAKITYEDGTVINTSLAGHLTDKEIHNYFKVGLSVNLGSGENDNMQKIVKCEPAPLKGLIISVYRDADGHDCTNNGISSKFTRFLLAGEGIPEIFEASEDCPPVRLVKRSIYPNEPDYLHVEPWERPTGSGWMYGGNHCYTSDSRFPNHYPLKIHDRQEF